MDESHGERYSSIGCLCLDEELLIKLESNLIKLRLEQKLWGELKWTKVSKTYIDKYILFLDVYFKNKGVTFHSWTYQKPTREELIKYYDSDKRKVLYKHAYLLIRSIIWKNRNSRYNGSYYVLADSTGDLGLREYKTTNELIQNDPKIEPKAIIDFCSTGASHICGAIQIADLCTGATNHKYESCSTGYKAGQNKIIEHLESINENIPLNLSSPSLPKLDDFKIHHCLCKYS